MAKKKPTRPAAAPADAHTPAPPAPGAAEDRNPSAADGAAFAIVGVGASAGGLDALKDMLGALPTDTGMGFVLVQHLAPGHASLLAEILSRSTQMPVVQVRDEPRVQPNHVYVIPPDQTMFIAGGKLRLLPRVELPGQHRPVDSFLRSLAQDQGYRAIGVILSGTATDGTLGLQDIKAEGGITFAQDDSAQYDSMPRSAVASGCVDFVLAPQEIAKEIARIATHSYVAPGRGPGPQGEGPDAHFTKILDLLRTNTGVDFRDYKYNTLHRRISRRMVLHKIETLADYCQFLRDNPGEIDALYQDILISVTSFFRNPEAFDVLKAKIFPTLLTDRSRHEPLRVWVMGCSSGEEAYSIAMTYAEYAEAAKIQVPMQIFATDLNGASIEKARTGVYAKTVTQDVSADRLRRFFVEIDGHFRISKPIRDMCVFARHNILSEPPFSRIDLAACRNLLIYLEPVLQQRVVPLLNYALRPGGILWLGSSETIGTYRDLFEVADAKHKFYAKKANAGHVPAVLGGPEHRVMQVFAAKSGRLRESAAATEIQREADRVLLTKYAPPGVVVNTDMEILQFRGDTGPYLTPAPGRASLNLLKMAREGLLVGLRAALHRARKEEGRVREEGLRVRSDGGYRNVAIEVVPLRGGAAPEAGFLVLFEEPDKRLAARPEEPARTRADDDKDSADGQMLRLTQELAATREYLQSVIEQQEAANEELQSANEEVQSANEELQSTNEELETSKEEIQSSNEELATVNDELHHRNQELAQSNNDLLNLLSSVQLAVVMLGRDLRIRRFTPAAEKLLNLIPTDLGRPIGDVKANLSVGELEPVVAEAIDKVSVKELDVQDKQGRWFALRIRPSMTTENQIDGAVIVLVDVDRLKRAHENAESIVDSVAEPLLVLDADLRVQRASREFYQMFQTSPGQTQNQALHKLDRTWDNPALRRELDAVRQHGWPLNDFELPGDFERVGRRTLLLNARRLAQGGAPDVMVLLTIKDITERKHLEEDLRERVEELAAADRSKNEFLAMLAHELRNPLAPLRNAVEVLKTPGVAAATVDQLHTTMDRQIENMTRIVDDLLDLSRITRGKIQLRKEPCNLATIIARSLDAVRHLFERRGQEPAVSLPDEPVLVDADPTRLEQVVTNLLTNASKFSERGGPIGVAVRRDEQAGQFQAVLRVSDKGIGIAPEMLPHVFDLFAQADRPLAGTAGGLGIGLTLVRRLVELHGGSVQAHSEGLGKGCEVEVRLPLLTGKAAVERPPAKTESPPDGQRRVLVVDDNLDAAETLSLLLRLGGHEVRTANDGAAALQAAAAVPPEIVLLDIGLPGMDGYEVARRLRRLPKMDKAVLVALTGYGQEEDRARAREAGFDHHLTKPAGPDALEKVFARIPRLPVARA